MITCENSFNVEGKEIKSDSKSKFYYKDMKDITNFVSILNSKKGEFDLSCGQAYVDGKSILGVLSLDIKRPLALTYIRKKIRY